MKCRHKNASFHVAVIYAPHEAEYVGAASTLSFGPGWANVVGPLRCDRCGEWLSLGPATHDRYAVNDEILAAEIALDPHFGDRLLGPRPSCLSGGRPDCEVGGCDGCDIWELARAIYTHPAAMEGE